MKRGSQIYRRDEGSWLAVREKESFIGRRANDEKREKRVLNSSENGGRFVGKYYRVEGMKGFERQDMTCRLWKVGWCGSWVDFVKQFWEGIQNKHITTNLWYKNLMPEHFLEKGFSSSSFAVHNCTFSFYDRHACLPAMVLMWVRLGQKTL